MSIEQPNKILVVEDDLICREMLHEILVQMGREVISVASGEEAFEIVNRESIRIVISDWQMEGMSGLELCKKIRARRFSGYVYFILLTSLSRQENVVNGLLAGADDFLTKPCDPSELVVRLSVGERIISLENQNLLVFSLAKLAESRDSETGAHLERMREYSRLLAEELSTHHNFAHLIDQDFIHAIYLTSPLHDIGKVGIPDSILLKPGSFTPSEFEVMKQHTLIGANTLDAAFKACPSAEYLCFARDIALSHHEKFNGLGYPYGLSGLDIPLCGRIVALADVYDALTTKRVYKEAFPHELAKEIIQKGSGSDFDPDIVRAFLTRETEFTQIREQLNAQFELQSVELAQGNAVAK